MVSTDAFLLAGRSLPSWVTGIAFVAANCRALEVMGVVSTSAKYGARANHFYWWAPSPRCCSWPSSPHPPRLRLDAVESS